MVFYALNPSPADVNVLERTCLIVIIALRNYFMLNFLRNCIDFANIHEPKMAHKTTLANEF